MRTFELRVSNRIITCVSDSTELVKTSVGVDEVHVEIAEDEWEGFPGATITFSNPSTNHDPVTLPFPTTELDGSDGYGYEGTVTIPWEVLEAIGSIRVTIQGTDDDGNHIITALGAPLSVVECGDSVGIEPSDPSVSEWRALYDELMGIASDYESYVDDAIQAAGYAPLASPAFSGAPTAPTPEGDSDSTQIATTAFVQDAIGANAYELPEATGDTLGGVMVDGDTVTASGGVISGVRDVWQATSASSAASGSKIASCNGFTLAPGRMVAVTFANANTTETIALDVASTGELPVYVGSFATSSTVKLMWDAGDTLTFLYAGDKWIFVTRDREIVQSPWYGTCPTAAGTAAKTVTCNGFKLRTGAVVCFTSTYANTVATAALTLNVNGTGAKALYARNAATSATNPLLWAAGDTVTCVYDGAYWRFVSVSNTQALHFCTCPTAAGTAAKLVACAGYTRRAGEIIAVRFDYANTVAAPTLNVNSTGAISIQRNGATVSTVNPLTWEAGEMLYFAFNNSSFVYIGRESPQIATGDTVGAVKPDGTYITIDANGTLSLDIQAIKDAM